MNSHGFTLVREEELREAGDVVDAHDVRAVLDGAQAHAERRGVAVGGLGDAGNRTDEALAGHGAHEWIA